ncbi:MAG: DNA cytosine methyltransferase [Acidobacteria bacterium]|nr:MAG: DNA cytosine methyltransferase [Acidobacteriota bacterium]
MTWTVVDLFSGAGGMSYGFHIHPRFRVVGAVDAQLGKPSSPEGSLDCNNSYAANIGVSPTTADLRRCSGDELRTLFEDRLGPDGLAVLCACPPCTGFSRTNPNNHLVDDPRNSLVVKTVEWVRALQPAVVLMENARELISGNFRHHYNALQRGLESSGYSVEGAVHRLTRFGLPQQRERALIVAVRTDLAVRTLEALWDGFRVAPDAITVRRAIGHLPFVLAGCSHVSDPLHVSPRLSHPATIRRMELMPQDGGSWADLISNPEADTILTPAMRRYVAQGKLGSHPDVYGRMRWDRPAPTIKRECAHVGNGRYTHPEQDRLCTVREMALLQGFPDGYRFVSSTTSNMYRHIGDAVPPLISYQLARLTEWILTGARPPMTDCVLPGTSLRPDDLVEEAPEMKQLDLAMA